MAARLIDHLKKGDMAKEAKRLLADTRWLPEPLRLAEGEPAPDAAKPEALPAFLDEEDGPGETEYDPEPLAVAAK